MKSKIRQRKLIILTWFWSPVFHLCCLLRGWVAHLHHWTDEEVGCPGWKRVWTWEKNFHLENQNNLSCCIVGLHCCQRLVLYLNNIFTIDKHFQTKRFLIKFPFPLRPNPVLWSSSPGPFGPLGQSARFGAGCYIEMALLYHQPHQHGFVGRWKLIFGKNGP